MAAVNFGGISPRMPDLSHGNGAGYGIVLVLRLFQGRHLFHSLLLLLLQFNGVFRDCS
jgi:hypothetical protein